MSKKHTKNEHKMSLFDYVLPQKKFFLMRTIELVKDPVDIAVLLQCEVAHPQRDVPFREAL